MGKAKRIIPIIALLTGCLGINFVFAESRIQINSHALNNEGFINKLTVPYIIADPQGRKLGFDPRNKERYKEFEGGYGTTAIDESYSAEAIIEPSNGNYIIELIGKALCSFDLEISIDRGDDEGLKGYSIIGVLDEGLTSKIILTYNSDPTKPAASIVRLASPSSLKQDISLSRKIGWIENDGIMNSLLKKAEAIEASIAKGKNDTAKNQLNAFVNEINAQKGKQIDEKAVKVFLEDVQYIIDQLK